MERVLPKIWGIESFYFKKLSFTKNELLHR